MRRCGEIRGGLVLLLGARFFCLTYLLSRRIAVYWFGGDLSILQYIMLGGLAGVCSGAAICPPEVIKVRMMAAHTSGGRRYTGVRDCARHLLATEGPRAFFRGLGPLLMRDVPFNVRGFLLCWAVSKVTL